MGRYRSTAATDEDATLEALSKGWPKALQRHPLHMQHTLIKSLRPPYSCDSCHTPGIDWSFLCATCDFDLHPDCALEAQLVDTAQSWPRTVQHTLHRAHPLVKTRLDTFWCDSCAERGSRWCFYCKTCDFSLHLQCAFALEGTRTLDKDRQQPPEKLTLEIVKTAMQSYWCSNCAEEGKGACYWCEDYDVDLHPGCATKGNQWPRSIVRKDHEHELLKSRSDKYYCILCWAEGKGCCFRCVDCAFVLHPRCATKEEVEGPGSWVEEVMYLRKREEMLQKFQQEPAQLQLMIAGEGTGKDDDDDHDLQLMIAGEGMGKDDDDDDDLQLMIAGEGTGNDDDDDDDDLQLMIAGEGTGKDDGDDNSVACNHAEEMEAMQRLYAQRMRLQRESLETMRDFAFRRASQTADTMEKLSRLVR